MWKVGSISIWKTECFQHQQRSDWLAGCPAKASFSRPDPAKSHAQHSWRRWARSSQRQRTRSEKQNLYILAFKGEPFIKVVDTYYAFPRSKDLNGLISKVPTYAQILETLDSNLETYSAGRKIDLSNRPRGQNNQIE